MRKQGWEKRLEDYFGAQWDLPFIWGENDCVLFAANAAQLLVDRDLMPEIMSYKPYDKARAVELIRDAGGSIINIFDKHFPQKLKKFAQRGDIAVVKHGGMEAAGVVSGRYVICKAQHGLTFINIADAIKCWSVE